MKKGQAIVEYVLLTSIIGMAVVFVYNWYYQVIQKMFWDIVSFWAMPGP